MVQKQFFKKKRKESSIRYHTMLPTIADKLVIKHGEKSEYGNKTHKDQKDEHYTIGGKIINNETNEESYCRFTYASILKESVITVIVKNAHGKNYPQV